MSLVRIPLGERPRILAIGWNDHDQPVDRWLLPDVWCLHLYTYAADLVVDGEPFTIAPGRVSLLAAGTRQEYRYHRNPARHLFCHFRPAGEVVAEVPLLSDPGADGTRFLADFDEARRDAPFDRLRSEVRLWDLLWRLVRLAEADRRDARPAVLREVLSAIDDQLGRPLSVAALAADHGLSHNALTRLFRTNLGTTVVGWIRQRRAERAYDHLRHSDLPAAEVARRVGVTDVHHLNRLLREVLGAGPQALRRRQKNRGRGR